MRDDISLAQLGVFVACARLGSFSAAARKLGRTQPVVSLTIAKLEARLGVQLFDRSARLPLLTDEGRALLDQARGIMRRVDELKARASSYAEGTETELSVAMDELFPLSALTRAVASFREKFPSVPLRLHVQAQGAVAELVLARRCRIGVLGQPSHNPGETLRLEPILNVPAVTVVCGTHVLAAHPGTVPRCLVDEQVQLVVSDPSSLTEGTDPGALSSQTWRLADLEVKREFLRAGFGWGRMPLHMVEDDLATGRLVQIEVEGLTLEMPSFRLCSAYRRDTPPGPAGRWLLDGLAGALT